MRSRSLAWTGCLAWTACLAAASVAGLAGPAKAAESKNADPIACADLSALELPSTTITLAEVVPAGAFVPPVERQLPPTTPPPSYDQLPPFCRVAATVSPVTDSEIRFEVWMPAEGWNGKFVGTGNGGLSGEIFYFSMAGPLERGYAVANTDTGHRGGGADASFAVGHPEKMVDYAWRAVHEMTVKSKDIVTAHYGTPVRLSYWTGCSSGGRQGLVEAQRFPADYDAIAAAAPANDFLPLLAYGLMVQETLTDPSGGLSPPKVLLLKEAALDACDAADGVTDRVVGRPGACDFDPAGLGCETSASSGCLSESEIEAARRIYGGVKSSTTGEQIFPGPEPTSEPEWLAYRPGVFPIGVNYFRDLVFRDPAWDPSTFDFDADLSRALELDGAKLAATDPDLSEFVERGGKLLLWHGGSDGLIPLDSTIHYYERVLERMGEAAVEDTVRLFLAPGVGHCSGGEGTYQWDPLAELEKWVEQQSTPQRIVASRPLQGGAERTRPLCPYPQVARYTGSGSTDDAESFVCVAPTEQ